jgi:hypothetical protein
VGNAGGSFEELVSFFDKGKPSGTAGRKANGAREAGWATEGMEDHHREEAAHIPA